MSHPRITAGIDGLPPEILLEVVKYTSLQDRVRFAQVSRMFRAVGLTPHLWADLRSWPTMRPCIMVRLVARALPSSVQLRLRIECTRNEDVAPYAAILYHVLPRTKDLYLEVRCDWTWQMDCALLQSAPVLKSTHIQSADDVEFEFPIFGGVAPVLETLWLDAITFDAPQPVLDTVRNFGTADFPVIADSTPGEDVAPYAAILYHVLPRTKDLYLEVRCDWTWQMDCALLQSAPVLKSTHIQSADDVEFEFPIFGGVAPVLETLWLDAITFDAPQPVLDTVRNFGTADFPVIADSTPGQAIETLYLIDFESPTSARPLFDLLTYAHLANLRHLHVEFGADIDSSISSAQAGHLISSCPNLQSMGFTMAPADLTRNFIEALPASATVLFDRLDCGAHLQVVGTAGTVFTLTNCDIVIEDLMGNSHVTDNVREIVIGRSALVEWCPSEIADFVKSVADLQTLSLVIGPPRTTFPEISNTLDPGSWYRQVLNARNVRELRITAPESFTVLASAIEGFVQHVLQHAEKLTTRYYYGFDVEHEDGRIDRAANPHHRWAHESRLPKLTRYLWSLRHSGHLDLDADRSLDFPAL